MKTRTLHIGHNEHRTAIKYYIFENNKSDTSKKMFIIGGVHGDEINGISIVRKILKEFDNGGLEKKLNGTIYLIPVVNRSGFEHNQRYIYEDGKDLNRAYGNSDNYTFANVIANELEKKIFQHCDFGIDVHDDGGMSSLFPHARIHANEDTKSISTKDLGRLFNSSIILERNGDENMLAVHMSKTHDIPVVTLEVGGGQRTNKDNHVMAINGIKNILIHYGLLRGKEIKKINKQKIFTYRKSYKAKDTCEVSIDIRLGDKVKKGDKIGYIYYPLINAYEDIIIEEDGIVFSIYETNLVPKGNKILGTISNQTAHQEN